MTPLLWSVCGLSVVWTGVAGMGWWGVAYEERWLAALTLQSLHMGGGWTADLHSLRNVAPSPLAPLLGTLGLLLMPSATLVLWSLSVLGVGLVGVGFLRAGWTPSVPAGPLVGMWVLTLWVTHPLTLSSLGMGWLLALGLLALGASLVEGGWERTGWLALGLSVLGRAEMALGLTGVLLWRWQRRRLGAGPSPWWPLALMPAAVWAIVAWVAFGVPWPETWRSAAVTSRSWLTPGSAVGQGFWAEVVSQHAVWALSVLTLGVIGLLALRRGTALAWAGTFVGAGCLVIHGVGSAANGRTWWLHLGPLFGLVTLAGTGLAWLGDPARPRLSRLVGVIVAGLALASQWTGRWELQDWLGMREQSLCWQRAGSWLRENTAGAGRIATTQPASLLWHLGVVHGLDEHRVVALTGPLSGGDPLARIPEEEPVSDTSVAELIHALDPDLVVVRRPEDDVIFNSLRSAAPPLGGWETLAEFEGSTGWRLLILGSPSDSEKPDLSPGSVSTPEVSSVSAANASLSEALRSPDGWDTLGSAMVSAGRRGLDIVSDCRSGFAWTPPLSVSPQAVAAIELTAQVKAEGPRDSTTLQIWWEGETAENPGVLERDLRVIPVESSWRFRNYRFRVGDNPLWRRFATIHRLRLDPAPGPFRATVRSLRLDAVPSAEAAP